MKIQSLLFLIVILGVRGLWAACSSPAGNIGELRFNSPNLQYCNGTSWVATANSQDTACSQAGNFVWDSALLTFKYCDGTNWQLMKGAAATGCGSAGNLVYDTTNNKYKFGDGTSCFYVGASGGGGGSDPCDGIAIGQACSGTTAVNLGTYAGYRYMTTPGGCTATVTSNPTCSSTDTSMYFAPVAIPANTATGTTDGRANTAAIAAADTAGTPTTSASQSAMKYCSELVYGNYGGGTDKWFIASLDETVALFYGNAASIPNLTTTTLGTYVTSTQTATNTQAYYVSMNTGAATAYSYTGSKRYARCVFKIAL